MTVPNDPAVALAAASAALDERARQLDKQAAELDAKAAETAATALKLERADAVTFCSSLASDLRILPGQQGQLVDILMCVPNAADPAAAVRLSAADGTAQSPREALKHFLSARPATSFREQSKPATTPTDVGPSLPANLSTSPDSDALYRRIQAYATEHAVSFTAATLAVHAQSQRVAA